MALGFILAWLVILASFVTTVFVTVRHILRRKYGLKIGRLGWLSIHGLEWTTTEAVVKKGPGSSNLDLEIKICVSIQRLVLVPLRLPEKQFSRRFFQLVIEAPKVRAKLRLIGEKQDAEVRHRNDETIANPSNRGCQPRKAEIRETLATGPVDRPPSCEDNQNEQYRNSASSMFFASHLARFMKSLTVYILIRWVAIKLANVTFHLSLLHDSSHKAIHANVDSITFHSSYLDSALGIRGAREENYTNDSSKNVNRKPRHIRRHLHCKHDSPRETRYILVVTPLKFRASLGNEREARKKSTVIDLKDGAYLEYTFPTAAVTGVDFVIDPESMPQNKNPRQSSSESGLRNPRLSQLTVEVPRCAGSLAALQGLASGYEETIVAVMLRRSQNFQTHRSEVETNPEKVPPTNDAVEPQNASPSRLKETKQCDPGSLSASSHRSPSISSLSSCDSISSSPSSSYYTVFSEYSGIRRKTRLFGLPVPKIVRVSCESFSLNDCFEEYSLRITDLSLNIRNNALPRADPRTPSMRDVWKAHFAHAKAASTTRQSDGSIERLSLTSPVRGKEENETDDKDWRTPSGLPPLCPSSPPRPLLDHAHILLGKVSIAKGDRNLLALSSLSWVIGRPPMYRMERDVDLDFITDTFHSDENPERPYAEDSARRLSKICGMQCCRSVSPRRSHFDTAEAPLKSTQRGSSPPKPDHLGVPSLGATAETSTCWDLPNSENARCPRSSLLTTRNATLLVRKSSARLGRKRGARDSGSEGKALEEKRLVHSYCAYEEARVDVPSEALEHLLDFLRRNRPWVDAILQRVRNQPRGLSARRSRVVAHRHRVQAGRTSFSISVNSSSDAPQNIRQILDSFRQKLADETFPPGSSKQAWLSRELQSVHAVLHGFDLEVQKESQNYAVALNLDHASGFDTLVVRQLSANIRLRRNGCGDKIQNIRAIGRVAGGLDVALNGESAADIALVFGYLMQRLPRSVKREYREAREPSRQLSWKRRASGSPPVQAYMAFDIDRVQLSAYGRTPDQLGVPKATARQHSGIQGSLDHVSLQFDSEPVERPSPHQFPNEPERRQSMYTQESLPSQTETGVLQLQVVCSGIDVRTLDPNLDKIAHLNEIGMTWARSAVRETSLGQNTDFGCQVWAQNPGKIPLVYSLAHHHHIFTASHLLKILRIIQDAGRLSNSASGDMPLPEKSEARSEKLGRFLATCGGSCDVVFEVDPFSLKVELPQRLRWTDSTIDLDDASYATTSLYLQSRSSTTYELKWLPGRGPDAFAASDSRLTWLMHASSLEVWALRRGIPEQFREIFQTKDPFSSSQSRASYWEWFDVLRLSTGVLLQRLPHRVEQELDYNRLLVTLGHTRVEYSQLPTRELDIDIRGDAEVLFHRELPFAECTDGLSNFIKALKKFAQASDYRRGADASQPGAPPASPILNDLLKCLPRFPGGGRGPSPLVWTPSYPIQIRFASSFVARFRTSDFDARMERIHTLGACEQIARLERETAFWNKIERLEDDSGGEAPSAIRRKSMMTSSAVVDPRFQHIWDDLQAYNASEWVRIIREGAFRVPNETVWRCSEASEAGWYSDVKHHRLDLFTWRLDNLEIGLSTPTLPTSQADLEDPSKISNKAVSECRLLESLKLLGGPKVQTLARLSLLLAMHLDVTLDQFTWRYRTHTFPFLSFGKKSPYTVGHGHALNNLQSTALDSRMSRPMWLHGLIMLAEKRPQPQSLRQIPIRMASYLTPSVVCRTLQPIKVYVNANCDFAPGSTAFIQIGPSVDPSMQDYSRVIELAFKPNADPSKPLPWWDKMRYLFHGRLAVHFHEAEGCVSSPNHVDADRGSKLSFFSSGSSQHDTPKSELILRMTGTNNPFFSSVVGGGCYGMDFVFRGLRLQVGGVDTQSDLVHCGHKFHWSSVSQLRPFPDIRKPGHMVPMAITCSAILLRIPEDRIPKLGYLGHEAGVTLLPGEAAVQIKSRARTRVIVKVYFSGVTKSHHEVDVKCPEYCDPIGHDSYDGFRSKGGFYLALGFSAGTCKQDKTDATESTIASNADESPTDDSGVFLSTKTIRKISDWFSFERAYRTPTLYSGPLFSRLPRWVYSPHLRGEDLYTAGERPYTKVAKERFSANLKGIDLRAVLSSFKAVYLMNELAPLDLRQGVGIKLQSKVVGIMYRANKLRPKGFRALVNEVEISDMRGQVIRVAPLAPDHSTESQNSANEEMNEVPWGFNLIYHAPQSWFAGDIHDASFWVQDGTEMTRIRIGDRCFPMRVSCKTFSWSPKLMYYQRPEVREGEECYNEGLVSYAAGAARVQQDIFMSRLRDLEMEKSRMEKYLRALEESMLKAIDENHENDALQSSYKQVVGRIAHLYTQQGAVEARLQDLQNALSSQEHFEERLGECFQENVAASMVGSQGDSDSHESSASQSRRKPSDAEDTANAQGYTHNAIVHNVCLMWNEEVRNVVARFLDQLNQCRLADFYKSYRAMRFLSSLVQECSGREAPPGPDLHGELDRRPSRTALVAPGNTGTESTIAQEMLEKLLSEIDDNVVVVDDAQEGSGVHPSTGTRSSREAEVMAGYLEAWDAEPPGDFFVDKHVAIKFINPQIKLECESDVVEGCDDASIGSLIVSAESMALTSRLLTQGAEEFAKRLFLLNLDDARFSLAVFAGNTAHRESSSTWLPVECIVDPKAQVVGFKRLVERTSAVWYHHTVNPVFQGKTDVNSKRLSRRSQHPLFESKTDFWHLQFHSFHVSADSLSFQILMKIVSKLLIYREPRRRRRLENLDTVLFVAHLEDTLGMDNVSRLREEVRDLELALRYDYSMLTAIRAESTPVLDAVDTDAKWLLILKRLNEAREELSIVMDAFKRVHNGLTTGQRSSKEELPRQTISITAEDVVWLMLGTHETPFVETRMTDAKFVYTDFEDQTKVNKLEVEDLEIRNEMPSSIYKKALVPLAAVATEVGKGGNYPMLPGGKVIRVYWREAPAVAGITVFEHFEANLAPLLIQVTLDLGKQVMSYIFPQSRAPGVLKPGTAKESSQAAARRNVKAGSEGSSGPSTPCQPVSDTNPTSMSPPAVAKQLEASEPSGTNPGRRFGLLRKRGHQRHGSQNSSGLVRGPELDLHEAESGVRVDEAGDGLVGKGALDDRRSNGGQTSSPDDVRGRAGRRGRRSAERDRSASQPAGHALPAGPLDPSDPLLQMRFRASDTKTFIYIKVPGSQHCFSYRGGKEKNFEDVHQFMFTMPTLEYRNQTMTWVELIHHAKWDFLRAALSHTGSLVKEMILRGKNKGAVAAASLASGSPPTPLRVRGSSSAVSDAKAMVPSTQDNGKLQNPATGMVGSPPGKNAVVMELVSDIADEQRRTPTMADDATVNGIQLSERVVDEVGILPQSPTGADRQVGQETATGLSSIDAGRRGLFHQRKRPNESYNEPAVTGVAAPKRTTLSDNSLGKALGPQNSSVALTGLPDIVQPGDDEEAAKKRLLFGKHGASGTGPHRRSASTANVD